MQYASTQGSARLRFDALAPQGGSDSLTAITLKLTTKSGYSPVSQGPPLNSGATLSLEKANSGATPEPRVGARAPDSADACGKVQFVHIPYMIPVHTAVT